MKTWQAILFGLFAGLLASAFILLVSSQPAGEPIVLLPPPTPEPLVVHVSGAVANPGLYELPPDSRVVDAVEAAGGLAPDANDSAVNLAAKLQDGQKIHLPYTGESSSLSEAQDPAGSGSVEGQAPPEIVDVNSADEQALCTLPSIGPVRAKAIIAYREKNGPFRSLEDLLAVPGIGQATLEQIEPWVTFKP